MIIKTNNGDVEYAVKELDFTNVVCDLEDYGINVMEMFGEATDIKSLSLCRGIIGVITGEKDKLKAGKMLTEHLKNGGTLDAIFETFREAMQGAGFGEASKTGAKTRKKATEQK